MPFKKLWSALIISFSLFNLSCEPSQPETGPAASGDTTTTTTTTSSGETFSFAGSFKTDGQCLNNDEYDACIFLKNPVSQEKKTFAEIFPSNEELETLQTLALNFNVTANSTELTNSTIDVKTASGNRLSSNNGKWKFRASNDPNDQLGQVMAHFWLTHAAFKTLSTTGTFWAIDKKIQVVLNDEFTGWSPSGNTIHLRKPKNDGKISHNAGLMIYFLALANLHYATEGKFSQPPTAGHRSCGESISKARHCCTAKNGCSMAIASGIADYFVATIFPESPTLGEAWVNRLSGLQACGLSRHLDENKDLNVDQAFAACTDSGGEGYIYNMGTVYASIWWQVRNDASSLAADIDRLYQHHLKIITPADDFTSAFAKISQTDFELFSGKHTDLFRAEFERRGIAVNP